MSYTNEKSVSVFGGLGLLDVAFVVFLILKLTHVIEWSWWWVTAPLWGQFALAFVIGVIVIIVLGIARIIGAIRNSKRK